MRTEKIYFKNKNAGFVALFAVTIIGFLAALFVVGLLPRFWVESKNVAEARGALSSRFAAISCLGIARLHILTNEDIENWEDVTRGEYYSGARAGTENCTVDRVQREGGILIVQTSATKNDQRISLETRLNFGTMEIFSIEEL